jgi:3-oxoacyl-[acyl-carrier protein] reductase
MRYRLSGLAAPLRCALDARLAAAGHRAGEPPDLVVVGAALPAARRPVLDITQAEWDATVAAIRAAVLGVRDAVATLVERRAPGRVVIVVDAPAVRACAGLGRPAVAGAFLTTVAQVAAAELGPRGIAVNVLVAGWTEPAPRALADATPLGRLAAADELAAACELLLSDRASFVTGATLTADGGWSITKGDGDPWR